MHRLTIKILYCWSCDQGKLASFALSIPFCVCVCFVVFFSEEWQALQTLADFSLDVNLLHLKNVWASLLLLKSFEKLFVVAVVVTAAIQTVTISTCAVPTLTDVISEQSLFFFFNWTAICCCCCLNTASNKRYSHYRTVTLFM